MEQEAAEIKIENQEPIQPEQMEITSDTSDDEEIENIMQNMKKPKDGCTQDEDDMDAESIAVSTSTFKTK